MDARHHLSRHGRLLRFVSCLAMMFGCGNWIGLRAADPVIDAARAKLYTARQESISLLEEAVLKSPQRADYWIELLRALETDSASPFVLRCYAHAALKRNPNSLPLRWEWLRLMEPEAALDELTELAKVEANLLILRDAREILELGLRLPRDWQQGDFYERWAALLIQEMKWERAAHVVARGLKLKPDSTALRTCEAMVLASESKYDESLAAIEKAGFKQSLEQMGVHKFPILSDILLSHNKPKHAAQAFGPNPSKELLKSRAGLILAQATLQAGDVERAEIYFVKANPQGRHLLVIANLLTLEKIDDARVIADELIDSWPRRGREIRRSEPDMDMRGAWPVSLESKFYKAIKWLYAEYPKNRGLSDHLTPPDKLFSKTNTKPKVRPASEELATLRKNMHQLAANPEEIDKQLAGDARPSAIRQLLLAQGRYAEAAKDYRQEFAHNVRIEGLSSNMREEHQWTMNQRYAAALPYFIDHPAELIAARQLLVNLKATRWNYPRIKDQAWLTDDEVAGRAAKLDARILPLVLEGLEPHTISGQDRTPWVQIIAKLGTKADVPPLLATMDLIVKHHQRHQRNPPEDRQESQARDQLTLTALNTALEQLTGVKCPREEAANRVDFWQEWWDTNAVEIVNAKP